VKNEEKLVLLKNYIHLFNKESNLAVFLLLALQGQMTPRQLIESTRFGKATIFRSLKDLSDAELVGTDIDPSIQDKRKNKFYFLIKELDDFPKLGLLDR
jgi:predicted transcriptional regulator